VFAQVSDIVNGEDIKLGEGTNWVWTVEKALSYLVDRLLCTDNGYFLSRGNLYWIRCEH